MEFISLNKAMCNSYKKIKIVQIAKFLLSQKEKALL